MRPPACSADVIKAGEAADNKDDKETPRRQKPEAMEPSVAVELFNGKEPRHRAPDSSDAAPSAQQIFCWRLTGSVIRPDGERASFNKE